MRGHGGAESALGGRRMGTDDVEDGRAGGVEQTRKVGRITKRGHIYVPGFFLHFVLIRSRD
jgi:hypothetical protein